MSRDRERGAARQSKRDAAGRDSATAEAGAWGSTTLHLSILAVASLALYAGALENDFVTDDVLQLRNNPFLTSYRYIPQLFRSNVWDFLHQRSNYYRPLHMLISMGEYHVFGWHAWAYHLVNLLLNFAAISAAYFLIRGLADARLAFWACLFFAFHPIHTEVVVWIAALPELLCALCLFTGVRLYHTARNGIQPVRNYGMATAVFFVGLFCKETTLVFPALLLAYEFFYRRESLRSIALGFRRFLPYLCAIAIYIAVRLRALGTFAPTAARFTRWQIVLSAPVLLCQYLLKALWPVNMNYFYSFTPQNHVGVEVIASVALIGALVAAMFRLRQVQGLLAFALAWFFVVIAPVLDCARVGENVFTERYLYIPSLGICIFAGWAWIQFTARASRKMTLAGAAPALVMLLILCGVLIVRRVPDWSSDLRLYQKTALQSPEAFLIQSDLGSSYYYAGQYEAAIAPLERSLALRPNSSLGHLYLVLAFSNLGDEPDAKVQLAEAERLATPNDASWSLFAQAYANLKQWDRAIECDRKEMELEPENPVLYTALAEALQEKGQTQESIAAFRRAIQLNPDFLDPSTNLAITLAEQGDMNDAVDTLVSALRSNPKGVHADAGWFNLGNIYAHNREWNEAAAAYQHALDLNPDLGAARERLESVEAQAGASQR
jgi:tetratricopeptide (TPR) repeat protein